MFNSAVELKRMLMEKANHIHPPAGLKQKVLEEIMLVKKKVTDDNGINIQYEVRAFEVSKMCVCAIADSLMEIQ
ncbi:hypothetical protein AB4Z50_03990 [Paenibacillus sp. 2TAB26]|uniref:hypothetical protein n=1 Tax=Paenibacillus sp. 2TAB26 TaxID=3233005 RepID=UPI003F9876DE